MEQLAPPRADGGRNTGRSRRVGVYLIGPLIGRGSFSSVFQGKNTENNQKVALKVVDKATIKTQAELQRLTREITLLRIADHPHVLHLEDVLDTSRNIYIVTQFCSGGSLYDRIVTKGRLLEKEAASLFGQLLEAVAYLHELGFVHRDIKSDNILLTTQGILVLTDFGLCDKAGALTARCGSPAFAAPEIINGSCYTSLVDLWSCGVTLFHMVTGALPFTAPENDYKTLYSKISSIQWHAPPHLSGDCVDLLGHLLSTPDRRFTAREALSHPWVSRRRSRHKTRER